VEGKNEVTKRKYEGWRRKNEVIERKTDRESIRVGRRKYCKARKRKTDRESMKGSGGKLR
jgi:hypothetical protein